MRLRVINDNGYKLELIRPLRECPFRLGQVVEVEPTEVIEELVEVFDKQLDEDTQARIIQQFKKATKKTK